MMKELAVEHLISLILGVTHLTISHTYFMSSNRIVTYHTHRCDGYIHVIHDTSIDTTLNHCFNT